MQFDKKPVVESYKTHATDTGSPQVQIALLTTQINLLSEHFKKYPKDFASRFGFLKMIGQRRRLLDYIKKHNMASYKQIIEKLELRK